MEVEELLLYNRGYWKFPFWIQTTALFAINCHPGKVPLVPCSSSRNTLAKALSLGQGATAQQPPTD